MRSAAFLDRDGVINRKLPDSSYVCSWSEFDFLPGAIAAIKRLGDAGQAVVVVTNQRGVARGKLSLEQLVEIHARMLAEIEAAGGRLAGIYVCPHEGGCLCRKPEPGLLLRAAAELQVDLHRSWMIGDSGSDLLAGRRAGCRTALISTAMTADADADLVAPDLAWCAEKILARADGSHGGRDERFCR